MKYIMKSWRLVLIQILYTSIAILSCQASDSIRKLNPLQIDAVTIGEFMAITGKGLPVLPEDSDIDQFKFYEEHIKLYPQRTFLTHFPLLPVLTTNEVTELKRFQFYVAPFMTIVYDDLCASLSKRIELPRDPDMEEKIFEIQFKAKIPKELGKYAAQAINSRWPGADITDGNIKIYPFGLIWLEANVPGWSYKPCLACWPPDAASLAGLPNELTCKFRGTERDLEVFANHATFQTRYLLPGKKLPQNSYTFSMRSLQDQKLDLILKGHGEWKYDTSGRSGSARIGHSTSPGQGALTFSGFSGKASMDALVTRDQIRTVAAEWTSRITGVYWQEFEEKTGVPEMVKEVFLNILNTGQAITRELKAQDDKEKSIFETELAKDLAPAAIAKLSADSKGNKAKVDEKIKATIKKVPVEKTQTVEAEDGVMWGFEGNALVPKSITLYKFDSSAFETSSELAIRSYRPIDLTVAAILRCPVTRMEDVVVSPATVSTNIVARNFSREFRLTNMDVITGDADVDTRREQKKAGIRVRSGHSADAEISGEIKDHARGISIGLNYFVQAHSSDRTRLEKRISEQIIQFSENEKLFSIVAPRRMLVTYNGPQAEDHSEHDKTGDPGVGFARSVKFRVDGSGNDNTGNAYAIVEVSIGYLVQVINTIPAKTENRLIVFGPPYK